MRSEVVEKVALQCGFSLAGVTSALPSPDYPDYCDWVSEGLAGKMGYLADHRADLRSNPRSLLPSAKSVICVGMLYNRPVSQSDAGSGLVARYAAGVDYHDVMRSRLETLAQTLVGAYGAFEYKVCVDTAPLLERSYARAAGLGWIGKNTCLINQEQGSWFFLGELLVSLAIEPDAPPPERCGTCTRCVDACPTDALVPRDGRFVVDSRLCISYFTIELKGEVPVEHRPRIGAHVFGCDICQDVCPWNGEAATTSEEAFLSGETAVDLLDMASMTEAAFRERFRGTPVWRSKYSGFLRNVAVAMGNNRDARFVPALQKLAASSDLNVAEHAAWALSN